MNKFVIALSPLKIACLWILFQMTKVKRCFSLLWKFSFRLKQVEFNYYRNWRFNNAYLLIDYKFENAIWVKVGRVKSIHTSGPMLLNLQGRAHGNLLFTIYGFFQKKVFEIDLDRDTEIKQKIFHTSFGLLNGNMLSVHIPRPVSTFPQLNIHFAKTRIHQHHIGFHLNPFKQEDYL